MIPSRAYRELPSSRQTTLLETLAAAASLLTPAEKTRPGAGPPPLLSFLRPLRPAPHLAAQTIDFAAVRGPAEQVSVTLAALAGTTALPLLLTHGQITAPL